MSAHSLGKFKVGFLNVHLELASGGRSHLYLQIITNLYRTLSYFQRQQGMIRQMKLQGKSRMQRKG